MESKKKKHTSEERAEELISRFNFVNNRNVQILCALEVAKENCYIYSGPCQMNTGHSSYWRRVKTELERLYENG